MHEMFFAQLTSERCTLVTANDRTVDEWDLPDKQRDNHWWDCLVGCAVAASKAGAKLGGNIQHQAEVVRTERKRISLAAMR